MNIISFLNFLLGFEVNRILGCGEIQDTEPIDEAIVLDSSLLQNLYEDTELVDNGNCGDEETLDLEYEGLNEVVDDSEDEGGGTGNVAAAESICLREPSPKAVDVLLESDGSNDHECQTGKHIFVCCYDASIVSFVQKDVVLTQINLTVFLSFRKARIKLRYGDRFRRFSADYCY